MGEAGTSRTVSFGYARGDRNTVAGYATLTYHPNNLIHTMVEKGWLGTKTKQGFYKQVSKNGGGKEFWVLNLETLEHEPPKKPKFDSIRDAKDEDDLGDRVKRR